MQSCKHFLCKGKTNIIMAYQQLSCLIFVIVWCRIKRKYQVYIITNATRHGILLPFSLRSDNTYASWSLFQRAMLYTKKICLCNKLSFKSCYYGKYSCMSWSLIFKFRENGFGYVLKRYTTFTKLTFRLSSPTVSQHIWVVYDRAVYQRDKYIR